MSLGFTNYVLDFTNDDTPYIFCPILTADMNILQRNAN